jgi:hypothetical protein
LLQFTEVFPSTSKLLASDLKSRYLCFTVLNQPFSHELPILALLQIRLFLAKSTSLKFLFDGFFKELE